MHGGVLTHGEVAENQHERFGVFADALAPGPVGVSAGEVGEHAGGFNDADVAAAAGHCAAECLGHVGFADSNSEGDRLQQLRAVLPCEVAGHGVTVEQANEALTDPDTLVFDPDYASQSGRSVRNALFDHGAQSYLLAV